ncbi:MAG TPA: SDR family NAD(P)-dependent oxidoreductase [Acidimicrobiales bacterium]|nr:SDR family NAD(P)-dependent oxidoreductase [Acidimicrobiales bacterium]
MTRVAIVTGGASGIGLAIAERLVKDGLTVAVFDLNEASVGAASFAVDVSDKAQVDAAVAEVATRLGAPTVLVNNAGIEGFKPFLDITLDEWNRLMAINLTGTFLCCQAVIPHMVEAGWGRIVNISSSSAQGGQQRMTHYVSSKAGVIGLTKSLALEFGPAGITVNTIPPGFIDTPMLRAAEAKGLLGPGVDAAIATTPVRRAGLPEDIAAAASFLIRDEASYVTGQVIGVNGGRNTG